MLTMTNAVEYDIYSDIVTMGARDEGSACYRIYLRILRFHFHKVMGKPKRPKPIFHQFCRTGVNNVIDFALGTFKKNTLA